jgi:UTP-glucose-1-phosphate uridylyltransferase
MVRAFRDLEDAYLVAVRPEPRARLARGGAARLGRAGKGGILPVLEMVEKPSVNTAIANARTVRGIVGRYILQPAIFSALHEPEVAGQGPFLELTNALAWLVRRGAKMFAYPVEAQRSDIGPVLDAAQGLISG